MVSRQAITCDGIMGEPKWEVIQSHEIGKSRSTEIPPPALKRGHAFVRTASSLVSVGTEEYMLELARKPFLGKALARSDLVH